MSGTPIKPWIIYARVSTEEQAENGISLAAQESSCRAYCKIHKHSPVEVIVDGGFSAKSLDRPGMAKILHWIESEEIAGLIGWRVDRLTRSVKDLIHLYDLCREHSVDLVSVTENIATDNPAGRLQLHLIASIAQWERESIAERIKVAIRHRMASGAWIGGPVPSGCQVIESASGKFLRPHPMSAEVVSTIWSMIARGSTLGEVAQFLTAKGVPPPREKGWRKQTVRSLISQRRLIGILVDEATFNAAQAALKSRFCPSRRQGMGMLKKGLSKRVFLLQQTARCALCGSSMFGYSGTGGNGGSYPYLRCSGRIKGICTAVDLPAAPWESAVVEALIMIADAEDLLARQLSLLATNLRENEHRHREELAVLDKVIGGLKQRLGRLLDLIEQGGDGVRQVHERVQALSAELGTKEYEASRLNGALAAANLDIQAIETLVKQTREIVSGLRTAPPPVQQEVLRALVAEARLAHGSPIRLRLWMPDPKREHRAGVPNSVFAYQSAMVEAPGIEKRAEDRDHGATRRNMK